MSVDASCRTNFFLIFLPNSDQSVYTVESATRHSSSSGWGGFKLGRPNTQRGRGPQLRNRRKQPHSWPYLRLSTNSNSVNTDSRSQKPASWQCQWNSQLSDKPVLSVEWHSSNSMVKSHALRHCWLKSVFSLNKYFLSVNCVHCFRW